MDVNFIFVYGTLRKAANTTMAQLLARHSHYIDTAIVQGVLYDVGGYLGVVESNNTDDKVLGEVHQLSDSDYILPLLDDYEECSARFATPHEYIRKVLPVHLTTGKTVLAWVYVYNWAISEQQRIPVSL